MKTIIVKISECKIIDEDLISSNCVKNIIADTYKGEDVWIITTDDIKKLIRLLY